MTAQVHPPLKHRLGLVATTRHCLTLGGRNLLHLKANLGEIVGFAVVQPLMVIALLVYVFGGAIAGDTATYLQFALPGLIVQSSVTAVLATGTGLHQDITSGLFDRLRSLPIARIAPLMGHLIGTIVRVVAGLVMLLVVGAAQGFELRVGFWATLAGLLLVTLFSAGLAWLSMLVALAAKSATTVHMFAGVVAVPLTFCSNVFVETSTMPGWLQYWADINPVSQATTALRASMTGGPVGTSVWWTIGWTVVLTAVFAPLSILAYRRKA